MNVDRTVPWDDPDIVGNGPGPAFVVCVGGHAVTTQDARGRTFWLAFPSKAGAENAAAAARAEGLIAAVRCHDPNYDPEDYKMISSDPMSREFKDALDHHLTTEPSWRTGDDEFDYEDDVVAPPPPTRPLDPISAIDYLLSRLRAQALARDRFGWVVLDDVQWTFPSWRHVRWPYDHEREQR